MKVIIDTEAKQISIIGTVTVEELNELVVKHSLQDYVLAAYELQTHFIPHNWELTPPFYPDCNAETTATIGYGSKQRINMNQQAKGESACDSYLSGKGQ